MDQIKSQLLYQLSYGRVISSHIIYDNLFELSSQLTSIIFYRGLYYMLSSVVISENVIKSVLWVYENELRTSLDIISTFRLWYNLFILDFFFLYTSVILLIWNMESVFIISGGYIFSLTPPRSSYYCFQKMHHQLHHQIAPFFKPSIASY